MNQGNVFSAAERESGLKPRFVFSYGGLSVRYAPWIKPSEFSLAGEAGAAPEKLPDGAVLLQVDFLPRGLNKFSADNMIFSLRTGYQAWKTFLADLEIFLTKHPGTPPEKIYFYGRTNGQMARLAIRTFGFQEAKIESDAKDRADQLKPSGSVPILATLADVRQAVAELEKNHPEALERVNREARPPKSGGELSAKIALSADERLPVQETRYRGIRLAGLENLAANNLELADVRQLLDRLPEKLWRYVPLAEINFTPFKFFSIEREGQTQYVREPDLMPTDEIIARKRGASHYLTDATGYQDGRRGITVFSTQNWEDRHDPQLDKDTALYTMAHEIGHAIYVSIVKQESFNQLTRQRGLEPPLSGKTLGKFKFLIENIWANNPPSQLPRFLDYAPIVLREMKRTDEDMADVTDQNLLWEEDFAVSMEHFLYWQNLKEQDLNRHGQIEALLTAIGTLE
jgi:hypothetical protein